MNRSSSSVAWPRSSGGRQASERGGAVEAELFVVTDGGGGDFQKPGDVSDEHDLLETLK